MSNTCQLLPIISLHMALIRRRACWSTWKLNTLIFQAWIVCNSFGWCSLASLMGRSMLKYAKEFLMARRHVKKAHKKHFTLIALVRSSGSLKRFLHSIYMNYSVLCTNQFPTLMPGIHKVTQLSPFIVHKLFPEHVNEWISIVMSFWMWLGEMLNKYFGKL